MRVALLKRVLVGRPMPLAQARHERLRKTVALAVFSSDAMSSVAYATEEVLLILVLAGAAAISFSIPIALAITALLVIVVISYQQTIHAYPNGGGAYIVAKDNLGDVPGLVAAAALLVDYVLTVSVSVAAGVAAVTSAVPALQDHKIVLGVACIAAIAFANIRGVRESGRIFAVPTYFFIVSFAGLLLGGAYRFVTGTMPPPTPVTMPPVETLTWFLVLRAFSGGCVAMTGTEAISNGIPAFRSPESRNAAITLGWMAVVLGTFFVGITLLANALGVVPSETETVVSQIARRLFGTGVLYYLIQAATALILVLAANTSFADFPRLASFHAGDAFMPRQLTKRGHRLVFSNGIVALAAAASLVLVAFSASVTKMIPLYALGVFTSFTLSQSGMAKRHLRLREKGWKFGLFVNGLGAIATLVVAIVIAIVKFAGGAWIVMVFVPILVAILVRVNKTYEGEDEQLVIGPEDRANGAASRTDHTAVVLVDELDDDTLHAAQYALTIRPTHAQALHIGGRNPELEAAWKDAGLRIPLLSIPGDERPGLAIARYLRKLGVTRDQVTVILPAPADEPFLARLRRMHAWSGLAESLRDLPNVGVVIVRAHGGGPHPAHHHQMQLSPRRRHVALILVEDLDRAVLKACRYARGIEALEVRAVHAASDPGRAKMLIDQWIAFGYLAGIPLDVEECNDRNIERSLRRYVSRFEDGTTEVTLILPRRHFPKRRHLLLHDRTSRRIAGAFAEEAHEDVVVVPYHLGVDRAPEPSAELVVTG